MNELQPLRDALIASASASRQVERFGGFVYLRHADNRLCWLNQTIPQGPCTAADLEQLMERYRETDRDPFFEFFLDLSPDVIALLEAAGLQKKMEVPILILPREEWLRRPYSDKAKVPSREELLPGISMLNEVFGQPGADPEPDKQLQSAIENGSVLAAIGFRGSEIVSMGQAVGTATVREVAGIGTRKSFRRQGFAGAVIDCLLDQFFSTTGEVAWITPGNDGAESVYRQAGFRTAGTQVCYGIADRRELC